MDITTHALNRTSPKGHPFRGTCFRCGATDLPAKAVHQECINTANMSADDVLAIACGDMFQ